MRRCMGNCVSAIVCVLGRSFVCLFVRMAMKTQIRPIFIVIVLVQHQRQLSTHSFLLHFSLSFHPQYAQFELIVPMCIVLPIQNQSVAFYFHICISNVYF